MKSEELRVKNDFLKTFEERKPVKSKQIRDAVIDVMRHDLSGGGKLLEKDVLVFSKGVPYRANINGSKFTVEEITQFYS
jgi:pyruvate/2-oxoacid:ferredoxin oxidoreductase alpha subunit